MSIVRMNESLTPESVAMKYICRRLGLNIRPDRAAFDDKTKAWTVPLRAFVPSKVSRRDGTSKTFVYNFRAGNLKLDEQLRITDRMTALELDEIILSQWNDLNMVIQREILRYAEENWGKLTFVRTFLRPIYTLTVVLLDRGKIKVSEGRPELLKWLDLLHTEGFVREEGEDEFTATNLLTGLLEEYTKRGIVRSNFDIADVVAGHLFARSYEALRDKFRIYAPTVYVDTAKLYYVDAVNFNEMIPIEERELFSKYRQMGNRAAYRELIEKGYSFATAVSELVAVGLLRRHEEQIYGDEDLFRHLVEFRDQITPSSTLISE